MHSYHVRNRIWLSANRWTKGHGLPRCDFLWQGLYPTDTNTHEQCYPLVKQMAPLREAPVLTLEAGDTHKSLETDCGRMGKRSRWRIAQVAAREPRRRNGDRLGRFRCRYLQTGHPYRQHPDHPDGIGGCGRRRQDRLQLHGLRNEIGAFWVPECVFISFGVPPPSTAITSPPMPRWWSTPSSAIDDYISIFLFDPDAQDGL